MNIVVEVEITFESTTHEILEIREINPRFGKFNTVALSQGDLQQGGEAPENVVDFRAPKEGV